MKRRINIGSLNISRIINGLWQIADMEREGNVLDPDSLNPSIQEYIQAGLSTFDMADHYGSSELIMGNFQQGHPDLPIQLLTKWVPKPGNLSKPEIRKAVQTALDRLQAEQIDLLQYHAWNYADPRWLDQMFFLDSLRQEGIIKNLGLTNVDASHLKMILDSGIPVITNQISYSLLDRRAQNQMEDLCTKYGVHILAFGTLAGGFLTDRWLGKSEPGFDELDTWSQMKYKRYLDQIGDWDTYQLVLGQLDDLAQSYDLSIANLATAYILNRPGVAGVIIGARLGASQHIRENLKILSFDFPTSLWGQIEDILTPLQSIPGNCGDEYRTPPFLTAAGDLSDHLDSLPAPYHIQEIGAGRSRLHSGTPWEMMAGYCRAIKSGPQVSISGTTATHQNRLIGGPDAASQTHFIIDKIEGVLQSFGGRLDQVVRTRIFVKNLSDWEAVARAHGQRFANYPPANTLVQANLVGEAYLVEIEADAVLPS